MGSRLETVMSLQNLRNPELANRDKSG